MDPFIRSRPGGFWVASSVLVVLAVTVCLSIEYWDWLRPKADTIRVIALVAGGVIAAMLALWRSLIAERQANAAQGQLKIAQLSLLNERYQKGAEMLGSGMLAVRLGGIYALRRLAEEHPQEYHVQIMSLFCAFARHPTKPEPHIESEPPLDIEAAMEAIALRDKSIIELENCAKFSINLRKAKLRWLSWGELENVDLHGADICSADLSHVHFAPGANLSRIEGRGVNLSGSTLLGVNLCNADFISADLTHVLLKDADLSCAILENTNLTEADLRGVRGLTQVQLDRACADPDEPPKLEGTLDAETGEPLTWRGSRPLKIKSLIEGMSERP